MTSLGTVAPEALEALRSPGAVILAGERLAEVPGALSAVARLADTTGARLAWVPRRAGDRGAIEAGALPNLLPVGRPVTDAVARAEVARVWAVSDLPATEGRDTAGILAAAAAGELDALVIAGVDLDDLPDPEAARAALAKVPFIVSLELRASDVTDRADVVFPVAAVAEKSGTFVNWEGRGRPFGTALQVPGAMSDLRVLAAIADEMDVHLGLPDPAAARRELAELGAWTGTAAAPPRWSAPPTSHPANPARRSWPPGTSCSAKDGCRTASRTWREPPGPPSPASRLPPPPRSASPTARQCGSRDRPEQCASRPCITEMPDRVVWLPTNAAGCAVRRDLGASTGTVVSLAVDNGTPVETATSAGSEK